MYLNDAKYIGYFLMFPVCQSKHPFDIYQDLQCYWPKEKQTKRAKRKEFPDKQNWEVHKISIFSSYCGKDTSSEVMLFHFFKKNFKVDSFKCSGTQTSWSWYKKDDCTQTYAFGKWAVKHRSVGKQLLHIPFATCIIAAWNRSICLITRSHLRM